MAWFVSEILKCFTVVGLTDEQVRITYELISVKWKLKNDNDDSFSYIEKRGIAFQDHVASQMDILI